MVLCLAPFLISEPMIRIKEIQEALFGLVGWEQSPDPLEGIEDFLTETESGLYFQGAHPLLTLQNVKSVMPDNYNAGFYQWDPEETYQQGIIVRFEGNLFKAEEPNKEMPPEPNDFNGPWRPYNVLSDYLESETLKAIASMVQKFQTNKTLAKGSNKVLQKDTFYPTGRFDPFYIDNKGSKVGFEIKQTRSAGISTRINRIGLRFTAPCKVSVTLEHSGRPVRVEILDYTLEGGHTQWFDMADMYIAGEENSYGEWRLTYDQRDLPEGVKGIGTKEVSCPRGSKYIYVRPLTVSEDGKEDFTKQVAGINVDVTIGCDLTDFLIAQKHIFANALQLEVATTLLRTMAMNPEVRVNANQSNVSRMDILYELDGNTQGYRPGGLGHKLKKAYEELEIDTSGMDRYCLPCKKGGVKYRAV